MRPENDYHNILFPLDDPRLKLARETDARGWGAFVRSAPVVKDALASWKSRLSEPFRGLTCDGRCEHGLFPLQDEAAPTADAVKAAGQLLASLTADQVGRLRFSLEAPQWRMWSNPEFLINDYGLRLEDEDEGTRKAVMALLAVSLGEAGFVKARDCMRTNAFLGQLTQLPKIMNEWSYNFALYGEPSETGAWGWNLWGHHLCINCAFIGNQMVVSPVFMGAEPNVIDAGPYDGTKIFGTQEVVGLELMQSLSAEAKERATLFKSLQDPRMTYWHIMDQRHVGGAYHDNRVVPYEGLLASELDARQRDRLMTVVDAFFEVYPEETRRHHLARVEKHLDRTYWSWIGPHGDDDPFYYRIYSPVVMLEFDHHSGVWLNNREPAKCHIHTVIRTPNGNDYGRDLLAQHYAEVHFGKTREERVAPESQELRASDDMFGG